MVGLILGVDAVHLLLLIDDGGSLPNPIADYGEALPQRALLGLGVEGVGAAGRGLRL